MEDTDVASSQPASLTPLQRLLLLEEAGAGSASPAAVTPSTAASASSPCPTVSFPPSASASSVSLPPFPFAALPSFRFATTVSSAQRQHSTRHRPHRMTAPIGEWFGSVNGSFIPTAAASALRAVSRSSKQPQDSAAGPSSAASAAAAASSHPPLRLSPPSSSADRPATKTKKKKKKSAQPSMSSSLSRTVSRSKAPLLPVSSASSSAAVALSALRHSGRGRTTIPPPPLLPSIGTNFALSASLTMAELRILANDPALQDVMNPSAGVLVEREVGGIRRRYVCYNCLVCGKQSGDRSKHRKHERACKKKILKRWTMAEIAELRHPQRPTDDERRSLDCNAGDVVQPSAFHRPLTGPAHDSPLLTDTPPSSKSHKKTAKVKAAEKGEADAASARQRPMSQTEMTTATHRALRAVYAGADAAPATCLLSRDSVLARIDLSHIFQPDLLKEFSAQELRFLCSHLPLRDQQSLQQPPSAGEDEEPRRDEDDGDAALDRLRASKAARVSSPTTLTTASSSSSSSPSPFSTAAASTRELRLLSATMADRSFGVNLVEYQQLLSTGSLDPWLKGLRQMTEARRRREERVSRSWKAQNFERFWGEALSETKVTPKPTPPAPVLVKGTRRPAVGSAGGRVRGGAASKRKSAAATPPPKDIDSDATQSDNLNDGGDDSDEEDTSEGGDSDSPLSPASPLSAASMDSDEPAPLHRRFRKSRPQNVDSMDEDTAEEEQSGSSSAESTRPPPLSLPLPAPPRVSLPLSSSYPIIQRFLFRSPRFRHIRRAVFVLRAPGVSILSPVQRSPQSPPPRLPLKRRAVKTEKSSQSQSSQLAFSHLPPVVARECAELRERVWTEREKAAARQRIDGANSARVRRAEMDRLDRALHAEARLLLLMEERGEKRPSSRRRRDDGGRLALTSDDPTRSLLTVRVRTDVERLRAGEDGEDGTSTLLASDILPAPLPSLDLRRRVFSPNPAASDSFSAFVNSVRQGPMPDDADSSAGSGSQREGEDMDVEM